MLDLFDLMTPRVVVVSEKAYNERKRASYEARKERYLSSIRIYEDAVAEIDKALAELVE
jgi:hypothetical protein